MLRCFQMGLHMADLEELEYGEVIDMMMEAENDNAEWKYSLMASQDDFDRF